VFSSRYWKSSIISRKKGRSIEEKFLREGPASKQVQLCVGSKCTYRQVAAKGTCAYRERGWKRLTVWVLSQKWASGENLLSSAEGKKISIFHARGKKNWSTPVSESITWVFTGLMETPWYGKY
jgi:hypothetical protein